MNAATAAVSARVTGRAQYRALAWRRIVILCLLLAALLFSMALDMALGPANYTLREVLQALFEPANVSDQLRVVIWDIRMPVAIMAVTVGISLSVAGAQMQTILANPLASPFTLGISAAASFGAALALVAGISLFPAAIAAYVVPFNAFIMAMAASLFIYFASNLRGVSVETIVLLGIALVFTFNAALALMQYIASEQALAQVVFWTMGSLSRATWTKLAALLLVFAVILPLSLRDSWKLTAIRLGEDRAASFGVDVRRLRLRALVRISCLAALAVAFVGTIGFIGIVVPHLLRLGVGPDHRFLLPCSALLGAALLLLADIVARLIIAPADFPIGILTALFGAPFFLFILLRQRGVMD